MDIQKVIKGVSDAEVSANDVSRISTGTIIKGDISSDCDIRIDGKVDGKIFSKGKVVVGENAVLSGGLACATTDFWGKMEGDIYVKDVLTLKSSAVVNGSLSVNKFEVEMGARVNGACKMITPEEYEKALAGFVNITLPEPAAKPAKK